LNEELNNELTEQNIIQTKKQTYAKPERQYSNRLLTFSEYHGKRLKYPNLKAFKLGIGQPNLKGM